MENKINAWCLATAFVLCIFSLVFAESPRKKDLKVVDTPLERRIDKDRDGKIEPNELARRKFDDRDVNNDGIVDAKEKRLGWRIGNSKVNTPIEKKYDANNDGWLDANEAHQLLMDRYALIKTDGRAKVNNALEEAYDFNKDGVIDSNESVALREDLRAK